MRVIAGFAAVVLLSEATAQAGGNPRGRHPQGFAIIFDMGYTGDSLPKDPSSFQNLIRVIKQAHFNTVLGTNETRRAAENGLGD